LRKWKTNDTTLRQKICESEKNVPQQVIRGLEEDETYAKSKLVPQSGTKGEKFLGLAWIHGIYRMTQYVSILNTLHVRKKARNRPKKAC
jgi:hypothetical protein